MMTGLTDTIISVIITSYNYERFIDAAFDSALSQTLPCEIIVVDDGSTDNSLALLRSYGNQINLLTKENGGESSAIWSGFQSARGKIIIILESDDLLYPNCAETVARHFSPGVAKVQYQLAKIGANGEDLGTVFPHYPTNITCDEIFEMNRSSGGYPCPPNSGNALSRDLLERILPVTDCRFQNYFDGYMNRLAPLYGSVVSLPVALAAYRVHGANFWARQDKSSMWETYVRHDFDRQEMFEARACLLGVTVPRFPLRRDPRHIENRILSLRFPSGNDDDTRNGHGFFGLVWLSVLAAVRAPRISLIGRVMWAIYLIFITACPTVLLKPFLKMTRGDGLQSPMIYRLICASKQ